MLQRWGCVQQPLYGASSYLVRSWSCRRFNPKKNVMAIPSMSFTIACLHKRECSLGRLRDYIQRDRTREKRRRIWKRSSFRIAKWSERQIDETERDAQWSNAAEDTFSSEQKSTTHTFSTINTKLPQKKTKTNPGMSVSGKRQVLCVQSVVRTAQQKSFTSGPP